MNTLICWTYRNQRRLSLAVLVLAVGVHVVGAWFGWWDWIHFGGKRVRSASDG